MQENPLVSIVIPAYNAAPFIKYTIDSILAQTYSNFEIIIINDGSTDNTEGVVKNFSDARIQYFFKQNEGVSIARNTGFKYTRGSYIVFFDADDLMSFDFLEKRINALKGNKDIGFCCGNLEFFPIHKEQQGACDDIPSEILLYYSHIETCPSNYMFRRNVVEKVSFHPQLASSADRFFLLQVAQFAKGKRIVDSNLKYRFSSAGMSGTLTQRLVDDNTRFYELVQKYDLIPQGIYRKVKLKEYYILAGMNWKMLNPIKTLWYSLFFFFIAVLKRS